MLEEIISFVVASALLVGLLSMIPGLLDWQDGTRRRHPQRGKVFHRT